MTVLNDRPYIIIGSGGHAAVVADLLMSVGAKIAGVVSPDCKLGEHWYRDIPFIGKDADALQMDPSMYYLALGIGEHKLRRTLSTAFEDKGFQFPNLIHPNAVVSPSTQFSRGAQIMAGSVVQARSLLGNHTIVNTQASVDHDCLIGDFCHVAPHACLCGGVSLGENVHVGAGAIVIQEIRISADMLVKAGTCIKHNV